MRPLAFFDRRFRGFRVVELGAAGFLLILVLVVYLAKTGAGDKRADIDRVQQQMDDETTQIRLLRAEVATLEQPERLEALSAQYLNLQPISANHEVTPEALAQIARAPVEPSAPAATSAAAAAATPVVAAASSNQTSQALGARAADDANASAKADQASNTPAPGERHYVIATAMTTGARAPNPVHGSKPAHGAVAPSIDSMLEAANAPSAAHPSREQR